MWSKSSENVMGTQKSFAYVELLGEAGHDLAEKDK